MVNDYVAGVVAGALLGLIANYASHKLCNRRPLKEMEKDGDTKGILDVTIGRGIASVFAGLIEIAAVHYLNPDLTNYTYGLDTGIAATFTGLPLLSYAKVALKEKLGQKRYQ